MRVLVAGASGVIGRPLVAALVTACHTVVGLTRSDHGAQALRARGAEPAVRHRQFGRLSSEQQDRVRGLAGVLRLARVLQRCGVSVAAGVHVDATTAYVRLRVTGVEDTEENAARLAAAKHLLERYLRRPVLVDSAKAMRSIHALRLAHSSPGFTIPVSAGTRRAVRHIRPIAGKRPHGLTT